eukprot:6490631-Amphidinium_carterae.1
MASYTQYHLHIMTQNKLRGLPGHWTDFATALGNLASDLKGGSRKKYEDERAHRVHMKSMTDLKSIKGLAPRDVLKGAVFNAFKDIASICRTNCFHHLNWTYKGLHLPSNVRGHLNTALAGCLYLDSFAGRKMEWEMLHLAHVEARPCLEQISAGKDYIVCDHHKTSKVYGSLAKWLTPGLVSAFSAVLELARLANKLTSCMLC